MATAPRAWAAKPEASAPKLIGFGSCARENRPQPIWDHVNALSPDLFLMLGDNIYADTDDMKVMRAKYAQFAAVPGFAKLRKSCPLIATWDDHDYGRNDAGVEYAMKKESQKEFAEFFDLPADAGPRTREGVYDAHLLGPADDPSRQVQVIMLDTRYFRDALEDAAPDDGVFRAPYHGTKDTNKTLLGDAQWKWLEAQLRVPAALRIIGSSIQFASNKHRYEKWGNFPHERQRLIDLIAKTQANGVVFISGDRHLAELSVIKTGIDGSPYPLYDVTSSGLNQGGGGNPNEPNPHRAVPMYRGSNFGTLAVELEGQSPAVTLRVHDGKGKVAIERQVALSDLRVAAD